MRRTAILADLGGEITRRVAEEYGIELIPLQIDYSDVSYDDCTTDPKYVYENMDRGIPETSTLSFGDIINESDEVENEGLDKTIYISVSPELNGIYNAFVLAEERIEGVQVGVFDSKNTLISMGSFAIFARKLIDEGFSLESIVETMKSKTKSSVPIIALDTLKHLPLDDKIGEITGIASSLLNLKLIVSYNGDGEYYTVREDRRIMKSVNCIIDIVKGGLSGIKDYYSALLNGDNQSAMEKARESINDLIERAGFYYGEQVTPTLSTHIGPGLFEVGCFKL